MPLVSFRFSNSQHRYIRRSPGPEEVEGAVVEPVHPRHFLSPFLSFFEPPPLYTENSEATCGAPTPAPRFEPPPPYTSTVDDRDTAGLILNECSESRVPNNMGNITNPQSEANPETMCLEGQADMPSEEVALATEAIENDINDRLDNRQCSSVANTALTNQHQRKNSTDQVATGNSSGQNRPARFRSPQHVSRQVTSSEEPAETANLTQEEYQA